MYSRGQNKVYVSFTFRLVRRSCNGDKTPTCRWLFNDRFMKHDRATGRNVNFILSSTVRLQYWSKKVMLPKRYPSILGEDINPTQIHVGNQMTM